MKNFVKDIKTHNIFYAIGYQLWRFLERIDVRNDRIRKKEEWLIGRLETKLLESERPDSEEIEYEAFHDRIKTPCGCSIFCDCAECSFNSICHAID